jgi:hypothetical protein
LGNTGGEPVMNARDILVGSQEANYPGPFLTLLDPGFT